MELFIFARFHAQFGHEQAVANALARQVAFARTEPGCLEIGAYGAENDRRLFFIQSRWSDKAAFEVHAALLNTVQFVESMEQLTDHPFDVSRTYRIA
jgi:quinol monooxygenase YgiN